MNISDDKITNYPKDDAIIIDNPRIFKGVLIAAKTWGSMSLGDSNGGGAEEIEELMADLANETADLRAKYEVSGDLLNGKSTLENNYYDELNKLLDKYRLSLFEAIMEYISDDTAIDFMLDLLRRDDKE